MTYIEKHCKHIVFFWFYTFYTNHILTILLMLWMISERVRLWCFRIFICIFIQITLTNLHVVRSCVYVFYMLYFWTRLSHHIVAAICLRFDVRILFNMKYMSSLGNLFGQEMQSNHEMDFTNFLLTAYLTLKLTEKLFQSVYIK